MQGAQWLVALAAGARQRDSLSRKGVSCGGGARWQLAAVPQHGPARSQRLAARLCGVTGGMGHGHGHARCGACGGYGSSFFQVKSAYLTAKTPKISRLARRARGALRRLARLRRAGSQVYSFSDIGSKCFTYSEHHSVRVGAYIIVLVFVRPRSRTRGRRARRRTSTGPHAHVDCH